MTKKLIYIKKTRVKTNYIITIGKSKTGNDTNIVTKESIKKEENNKKIVVLQSEEERAKDIWQVDEVIVVPEELDVVSDIRIRPDYDIKYQQYVGTEDVFLQVN